MQRATDTAMPSPQGIPAPAAGQTAHDRAPPAVVWTAGLGIVTLVCGAVYLVVVRGDALLLDLSALSRFAFCF